MPTEGKIGSAGISEFKARLYEHYPTEHFRVTAESAREQLAHDQLYLRRAIARCIPADRSAAILDLGCGYGALLSALRNAGYTNLTGVDISPEQVNLARYLGFDNVHWEGAREFLSRIADRSYDAVVAFDVLEHLTRAELLEIVCEVCRVLKPGGRFVVHVPNGEGLFFGSILFGDLTHELAFTQRTLSQLAEACNLRLVRTFEDRPVVHGPVSLVRSLIWSLGTLPFRLLSMAETGEWLRGRAFSRNILAILERA